MYLGRRGGPNIFGGGEGGHAKIIEGGEGESRPNYWCWGGGQSLGRDGPPAKTQPKLYEGGEGGARQKYMGEERVTVQVNTLAF